MARKLFIPKKCRVGFQHRTGTFTNKLAYVIYYDALGKIRKEKSWKGWCHLPEDGSRRQWDPDSREHIEQDGIEPFDFENEPTSGFVLNKGIRRYNWSHFGSGRSMCRIYDPRGIEFEITIENLVGLLMHTDCSRREIQGELVYAWCGGDLMLLPCTSEEYEAAKNYTQLQAKKIGARELKEGVTYVTKQEEHLVYLGRHMWYEEKDRYGEQNRREGKKQHIFCDIEGKSFKPIKSVPSTIAAVENEHPHDNTANWIDAYMAHVNSSPIIEWIEEPLTDADWNQDWDKEGVSHWDRPQINCFMKLPGDQNYYSVAVQKYKKPEHNSHWHRHGMREEILPDGSFVYNRNRVIRPDGSSGYLNHNRGSNFAYGHSTGEGKVTDRTRFFRLKAKYQNGHIQEWS